MIRCCLLQVAAAGWIVAGGGLLAAAEIDFAHQIVPILRESCGNCHTGGEKQGGFSMNTRASLLAGGDGGQTVVPGDSDGSALVERISSDDEFLRMPPEGPPLPADKVALLRGWIDAGVPWESGFSWGLPGYEPPLLPRRPALPSPVADRADPVDRLVDAYLAEHQVAAPEPVDDAVFLRRAWLDLLGLLPPPEALDAFLRDQRPNKRQELIDQLLAEDLAYAEHWLSFWNDLLRNDYTGTGYITGGRKQITDWLYRALVENKPYDQMVRELIAPHPEAEGFIQGIRWRGDVSASQTQEIQFAQNISQAFLGINLKCASCHNSFIDRWTLEETYGLAAVYGTRPLELHRCDKPLGTLARAAWIFPELGEIEADAPQPQRLQQLAALMTHPENGRFTRTIVNRLWHRLMGRGIVHPVDAMHTPPWNADLLDYLAVHLADSGYDLKATLRLICTSQTYQGRTPVLQAPPETADYVFRGPLARRLTAEQFLDAVWQITAAGPRKADAQVLRRPPNSHSDAAANRLQPPAELAGRWIWSYPAASSAVPAAGETITLRRRFDLPSGPVEAAAVVTCDNEYRLYINGRQVAADDDWETVERVPLADLLQAGGNEILIVARNAGSSPNPAGLVFEARLRFRDAALQVIASDEAWQWTAAVPDPRGSFARPPDDWQAAAVVTNPQVWASRVETQLVAQLADANSGSTPMVRAALMKNDAFMTALGRPTRDQIVSMRPGELTTLEAINLSNGQQLADALVRGAEQLLAAHGGSPPLLTAWLFRAALAREPTAEELELTGELLGREPGVEEVQDLLWAVFMLPEFQLVR